MQEFRTKQLTELDSWKNLTKHAETFRLTTIKDLKQSALRNNLLRVTTQSISIDFSNQRINETTLELLLKLANERNLKEKITALMQGEPVNQSEKRPALHTALRSLDKKPIVIDGRDIISDVYATREKMRMIANQIRAGQWLGFSGRPITDIVNIGIGGSDLGPRFCIKALSDFTDTRFGYHFVSDVDPNAFNNAVAKLNPETTLFIIASKSFTTQETLYNAKAAFAWLGKAREANKHFIAVTANRKAAQDFGIDNVLPIWDWVGGRYSLCSAINLITAIAIGFDQFTELLAGAHSMDQHFKTTPFEKNLPVLLALIGIWNNNFLHIHNLLVLTYAQQLEYFVPYIQQVDMESNGKSIDSHGGLVNYATGPIIWGGLGNQAQHSYYQLLCQGTHRLTVDFITIQQFKGQIINQICDSKQKVLAEGITEPLIPDGYIPGNIPLNNISISTCSPFNFGELIALYEHKVYTQSVIWDINPFDQPGVESSKRKNLIQLSESLV
ncbi:glucose-6-phosphate isomerase [Legionella feeleii]|uniref:Glucose-6-phosphate isomerase n=1 Tax=Legionella feeleii TaxID=453 RepID=A0A378IXI4_9GAMM|nr:glucose-6-phosphate isomerase [Legionella feeleii]STX39956.1 glucose-6-phosphate isomerase [Legionella feeleii]